MSTETIVYFDGKFKYYSQVHVGLLSNSLNFWTWLIDSVRLLRNDKEVFSIGLERYIERFLEAAKNYIYPFHIEFSDFQEIIIKLLKLNKDLAFPYMRLILFQGDASLNFSRERKDFHFAIIPLSLKVQQVSGLCLVFSEYYRDKSSSYKHKFSHHYGKNLYHIEKQWLNSPEDIVVFLDQDSNILECISENIFFIKGRHVLTPRDDHILRWVNREIIISLLRENQYDVFEQDINKEDIKDFDEIILSWSATGVRNIEHVWDHTFLKKETWNKIRQFYEESYYERSQIGNLKISRLI